MIIYQIKLPKTQDAKAFVSFMREEYFPAVHKGPTRVGQVTELKLLERQKDRGDDRDHEFYWHVGWSGLASGEARVDDEDVVRKFKAFKAKVKRVGFCKEVVAWPEADAG
ncbi:MAG: hypothetical protein ND866_07480 [Pyrinomonadaceae bacterium]|nr:hypothetical protein [Pyrinomonadaceae bacterium]